MLKSMQSEPSRTRCGPSFARAHVEMKAYSYFARTEYAKTKSAMQSRQT
jgi:hypothetical protein